MPLTKARLNGQSCDGINRNMQVVVESPHSIHTEPLIRAFACAVRNSVASVFSLFNSWVNVVVGCIVQRIAVIAAPSRNQGCS